MMEADNTVSYGPLPNSCPDAHDRAGNLMTKDLWRLNEAVRNLLHIRPANAASSNTDQNFTVRYLRYRNIFGRHSTQTPINSRSHVFWNRNMRLSAGLRFGVLHFVFASVRSAGSGLRIRTSV